VITGSPPFLLMPILSVAFAVLLTLTSSHALAGALPFAVPLLRVSGLLQPSPGHRLFIVSLRVAAEPIDDGDISRFTLITSSGRRTPIGAGATEVSIVPLDRIPVGGEVGEILRSDAMLVLTRGSSTRVAVEVGPQGTIALLFEVPVTATISALRLPDGSELATKR
jgi:hypothetical protein